MRKSGDASRSGIGSLLFWGVVVAIVAADLGTKSWAFSAVLEHGKEVRIPAGEGGVYRFRAIEVWQPYFFITRAENTGTIWGLFQGQTFPLIAIRLLMVGVLAFIASRCRRGERAKLLGLGLVLGGALGNLYDNLTRETHGVRDFLDFWIPLPWRDELYHYPTFNIADASILCGAVLLFFAFGKEPAATSDSAASASDRKPETGQESS